MYNFDILDHFVTVPTLAKFQSLALSGSLTIELSSSNAIGINDAAVIVSPGYPFYYPSGQIYKWIVSFGETEYVKLIFTNISLHIDEVCIYFIYLRMVGFLNAQIVVSSG